MVLRFVLCAIVSTYVLSVCSQADSILLEPVEVVQSYGAAGSVQSRMDTLALTLNESASLGDVLQASSGVYIRRYGAEGQLSTVSFRGTTPSQTQVSWKGVDINSQTLGQSDFSSIPSFLFSSIQLHHGANSTLFGSGAVGGVVELENRLLPNTAAMSFTQYIGSFGKVFTGIKGQYDQQTMGLRIAAVRNRVENNFPVTFRNETYEQNNASSYLDAIVLDGYLFVGRAKIGGALWYNHHDRESQPIIGDIDGADHLLDRNLRMNLSYERASDKNFLKISFAHIIDRQTYNKRQQTNLDRSILAAEYEFSQVEILNLRTGVNFSYAQPEVSSYVSNTDQIRADWFLLSDWQVSSSLSLSGNVRVPYAEGIDAVPLVPSFGMDYQIVDSESLDFKIKVTAARSFRFPTLNDQFWGVKFPRELSPENGWSTDVGGELKMSLGTFRFSGSGNLFRSSISDMIVWLPAGTDWLPENVRSVEVNGVEVMGDLHQGIRNFGWKMGVRYSYNHSQDLDEKKQLPYVPYHKGALTGGVNWQDWHLTYQQTYTGLRFTETTNTSSLEGFWLSQVEIGKTINLSDHSVRLAAQVNNLLNADYQNYELRAVPGRHFLFKLNYQLIKSK